MKDKKSVRKEIKNILFNYKDNFENESLLISEKILNSEEFKNADTILSYMALPDEVNINCIVKRSEKNFFIPKVNMELTTMDFFKYCDGSIKSGSYDIDEPDGSSEKFNIMSENYGNILILVPGRAFTKEGIRLGRGKGYYDKFISNLKDNYENEKIKLAGVCFLPQVMEVLPFENHDIKMDLIFTGDL